MAHDALVNLLENLVGKKLGNFLGRPGFNNLGGSHDHGLVREITGVKTNCLEVKKSSLSKIGKTNTLVRWGCSKERAC